jgi:hypothetical protein
MPRHLLLYRQVHMLRAQGTEIDRAVLAFWVAMRRPSLSLSICGARGDPEIEQNRGRRERSAGARSWARLHQGSYLWATAPGRPV